MMSAVPRSELDHAQNAARRPSQGIQPLRCRAPPRRPRAARAACGAAPLMHNRLPRARRPQPPLATPPYPCSACVHTFSVPSRGRGPRRSRRLPTFCGSRREAARGACDGGRASSRRRRGRWWPLGILPSSGMLQREAQDRRAEHRLGEPLAVCGSADGRGRSPKASTKSSAWRLCRSRACASPTHFGGCDWQRATAREIAMAGECAVQQRKLPPAWLPTFSRTANTRWNSISTAASAARVIDEHVRAESGVAAHRLVRAATRLVRTRWYLRLVRTLLEAPEQPSEADDHVPRAAFGRRVAMSRRCHPRVADRLGLRRRCTASASASRSGRRRRRAALIPPATRLRLAASLGRWTAAGLWKFGWPAFRTRALLLARDLAHSSYARICRHVSPRCSPSRRPLGSAPALSSASDRPLRRARRSRARPLSTSQRLRRRLDHAADLDGYIAAGRRRGGADGLAVEAVIAHRAGAKNGRRRLARRTRALLSRLSVLGLRTWWHDAQSYNTLAPTY